MVWGRWITAQILGATVWAMATGASAAIFDPVKQSHEVYASTGILITEVDEGGHLGIQYTEESTARLVSAPGHVGVFDERVTNDVGGFAQQTSVLYPDAIRFSGAAFAPYNDNPACGHEYRECWSEAHSVAQFQFTVANAADATLAMTIDHGYRYSFGLVRDGTILWDKTSTPDGQGLSQYSFRTLLNLAPGSYQLFASVSGSPDYGAGDIPATASFSLIAAAIPEPETYALMLAGLVFIGITARRQRVRISRALTIGA